MLCKEIRIAQLFLTANMLVIVREYTCHETASSALGRRDGGTVCDTDRCCPPGQFCAAISLICAPCALCAYDGDSAGFSCRARCGAAAPAAGTPDLLPPELLWLSLTPGAVDASVAWQPVELRFGVRVR